eukprot:TRINITY_DN506_c0_g1_i16.p11 TRINITY_DN506_c0_g1~~TRINITY_DN506_c0_g1_i16.p11  ORF type:complete len:127 (-),score=22.30 TRINITY_DN506_c0_g1_i16:2652-3032(-)
MNYLAQKIAKTESKRKTSDNCGNVSLHLQRKVIIFGIIQIDNLSAEEDKKKAKERLYKPAGKKLEPKEDEKVPAGQKRKLVVEPQNSKRRKKDPEEEEDIKQSYKIMVTGKTHFAEYKKVISLVNT